MTELKVEVTNNNNQTVTHFITNESEMWQPQIQDEIDSYMMQYVNKFNETNKKHNIYLKSLKIYYGDDLIRNITKN